MGSPAARAVASHALAATALSLPWPLLLVLVDERTADPLLLGLAAAARMLPYVAFSWAAGRLADRFRRDAIVRLSLVLRVGLLTASAAAVALDQVLPALVCATVAVAVATPAFPAVVAAMPGLAGRRTRAATDLVVTVEVAAFTVGAALGGLLLHPSTRPLLPAVAVLLTLAALVVVAPVRMPTAARRGAGEQVRAWAVLRSSRPALLAVGVMAVLNLVLAALALALLPLAEGPWASDAEGYGLASGVLGLAALGGPLVRRVAASPTTATVRGLGLTALGVLLVVPATGVGPALLPLALVGAAAVAVESAATSVLQERLPDEVRATALGVNDTVIVAAAMAGSLLAPLAVAAAGGTVVLLGLVALLTLAAGCARVLQGDRASVEETQATSEETDVRARPARAARPHPSAREVGAGAAGRGPAAQRVQRIPGQRRPAG